MRSRLAIIAVLATGVLFSSGGAALGASALLTDLTASSAQYGNGVPPGPEQPNGQAGERLGPPAPQQPTVVVQVPRQVAAPAGGGLPFTGYASIPLLLIGVALLVAGVVLRRGAPGQP